MAHIGGARGIRTGLETQFGLVPGAVPTCAEVQFARELRGGIAGTVQVIPLGALAEVSYDSFCSTRQENGKR